MHPDKISLRKRLLTFFDNTSKHYTEWELFDMFRLKKFFYMPGSISRICRKLVQTGDLQSQIRTGTDYVEFYK